MLEVVNEGGMSEDLFYLNVIVLKEVENLFVMVWFYGGFFVILLVNFK